MKEYERYKKGRSANATTLFASSSGARNISQREACFMQQERLHVNLATIVNLDQKT